MSFYFHFKIHSRSSSDLLFGLDSLQPTSLQPPPVMMRQNPSASFITPTLKSVGSAGSMGGGIGSNNPIGRTSNPTGSGNVMKGVGSIAPNGKGYDPFNDLTGLSSSLRNTAPVKKP